MTPDEIDAALLAELDRVHAMEQAGELDSIEVITVQRLLGEAAAWMRGFRSPESFEEAWERVNDLKAKGRLGAQLRE